MKYLIGVALLFSLACHNRATAGDALGEEKSMSHTLKVKGAMRTYNLYRPLLPEGEKVPLLIVLHGGLGNAKAIEASSGMDAVADTGRFIVAYPDGTEGRGRRMKDRRTWNAGVCCGPAVNERMDDVAFISAMIDEIAGKEPIDLRRVYAAGMSNGAMMAYRLACEIPEKLAAIVAVSGTLAVDDCSKAKNVAVMHIHGDSDQNVPFEGGAGENGLSNVAHRSIPETMRMITAPRGCAGSETAALSSSVERTIYRCAQGSPVELLVIKGGGHAWPGGRHRGDVEGASNAISASETAWNFVKQFTRKP